MGEGGILKILVPGRKDARAIEAMLEAFMPGWRARVESLGGMRGDKLLDAARERMEPFTVALLGSREERVARELEKEAPMFSEVLVSRAAKVRNNPLGVLHGLLSMARAGIRLRSSWVGGALVLARVNGSTLTGAPITPQGDSFLVYGQGARVLSLFLVKRIPGAALLYKAGKGRHLVYAGPGPMGEVYFGNGYGPPRARTYPGAPRARITIGSIVEANRDVVKVLERHTVEVLRRSAGEPDLVLVPWSGGKDSTAALLVALEAFGRDRVKAVYVDTGIDFPENLEYVEEVASSLRIDYIVKRATVDDGLLLEGMPMPDPDYRWCTGRKLDALREGFREAAWGRVVVVTGDRDAESERRAKRPPVRMDEKLGYPVVSPLKLWSGAHVQAYILSKGVPLNPLYEKGFYRIGCYICFALRGWEIEVMRRGRVLDRIVGQRPDHKVLIDRFLEMKRKGFGGDLGDCICGA
ncbi:MAG: phosphoadenosine phosphosulfate reductase family protein [Desulfurococcales archaeon]|nr:phosphoadenosine phosphosulfate reductase family protein [Desulfurococcales archaeon]MCE4604945.1 phosphoadenosine phosphosulfate reductase family protein [Desulfurococcales archaeon]